MITGFLARKPGCGPASSCEPYRELIALELERGRNAMGIWQDLVDSHGFAGGYQCVRRFVCNLRGAATPEARAIIETPAGEECQVDYGTGPMVRDPDSGKYRRTRLFVLTLGCSRKSVRLLSFRSVRGCGPSCTKRHFAGLAACRGSWFWITFARVCCLQTSTIRA